MNERLRDARRKLGVSSSREAARLLAEVEGDGPQMLGDKQFGVAPTPADMADTKPAGRSDTGQRLAWLSGGMLMMSIIVAAAMLSNPLQGTGGKASEPPAGAPGTAGTSAAQEPARQWLSLVDGRQWERSWQAAGTTFRAQVTAAQWQAMVGPIREPLGGVSARVLQKVDRATTLPGAPDGTYELLQFQTDFATRPGALETVVLAKEDAGWRVAGYFIR